MSWKNKLLTLGGRYVLIKHVLHSLSTYQISVINPPKGVIDNIHRLLARFFWGNFGETKGRHWIAREKLCFPLEEGGIGIRSLHHIVGALFGKLWWNFRTATNSLWSRFIWNKYCKKLHPMIAKGVGVSQV